MKERPILFNDSMVRAILDGRKTQTRRVVKSPYKDEYGNQSRGPFEWIETPEGFCACLDLQCDGYDEDGKQMTFCCPYGVPGDRLWVRETFQDTTDNCHCDGPCYCDHRKDIVYRADVSCSKEYDWTPSIHMPRWASRLLLEVTAVRVERLQDISEEDAKAEGIEVAFNNSRVMHRIGFMKLWNSINIKRGFDWDINPWVWVIEFRRIENAGN